MNLILDALMSFDIVQFFLWVLYLSPMLLIVLWDTKLELDAYWVYIKTGYIALFAIFMILPFNFSEFDNFLLAQYVGYMWFAHWCYNSKYDVWEAFILAWVTVWINSFYWEYPFHFLAFLTVGVNRNFIQQSMHLLPVPWLLIRFRFWNWRMWIIQMLKGLAIGFAHYLIRYELLSFKYLGYSTWFDWMIMNRTYFLYPLQVFNRAACLMILINVLWRMKERAQ